MKWTHNITSTANGGRSRRPSGMNELISATSSDRSSTVSTSSRNARRRVRLLYGPSPKLVCFMLCTVSAAQSLQ